MVVLTVVLFLLLEAQAVFRHPLQIDVRQATVVVTEPILFLRNTCVRSLLLGTLSVATPLKGVKIAISEGLSEQFIVAKPSASTG